MHKCSRCGLFKDPSEFYKAKAKPSGLQHACKECAKANTREWLAKHPGKTTEYSKRYEQSNPERRKELRSVSAPAYAARRLELGRIQEEKNREKRHAQARERIANNRDHHNAKGRRWREANPEKARAMMEKWRRANPGAAAANAARWRAALVQATPAWANQKKIAEFYETADGLSMLTGEWYHVDHIVPLQGKTVRGLHCEANLQVLPEVENIRKGNRHWPDQP